MTRDEILAKVRDILVDQLGVEADSVKLEASFQDDLNADSLDLVELIMELEDQFTIKISDEDLRFKMSAAAARHALQFDWDKVARDWESVFVEAAGKRRKKN